MIGARIWRHFDYVLLLVTVLLTIFGVVMVTKTCLACGGGRRSLGLPG